MAGTTPGEPDGLDLLSEQAREFLHWQFRGYGMNRFHATVKHYGTLAGQYDEEVAKDVLTVLQREVGRRRAILASVFCPHCGQRAGWVWKDRQTGFKDGGAACANCQTLVTNAFLERRAKLRQDAPTPGEVEVYPGPSRAGLESIAAIMEGPTMMPADIAQALLRDTTPGRATRQESNTDPDAGLLVLALCARCNRPQSPGNVDAAGYCRTCREKG
jgi:hypothetical protein